MIKPLMNVYRRKPLTLKATTVGMENIHILAEKFHGSVTDVRTPDGPELSKIYLLVNTKRGSDQKACIGDILAYNESTGELAVYDQLKFLSMFELVNEPATPTYLEN